jgi:predicted metalloprotease with PDZ domain
MVRCGLVTPGDYRQTLAGYIREMQKHVGRNWRSLEDTAIAGHLLRRSSRNWPDLRRDQDFYYEGLLLWLECDAIIREKTKGTKSLDDFCKIFFAAVPGKKTVAEYEFSDVVAALNKVVENDWEQFLTRRVTLPQETLPLDVVGLIGYKMGFSDKQPVGPGRFAGGGANAIDSLGVTFFGGQVGTVIPAMPGDKAGLAPGMTILGVNGKKFNAERLREALTESVKKKSIDFLVEEGDSFKTLVVPYEGGVRYLDMTRAEGKPDVLAEILKGKGK